MSLLLLLALLFALFLAPSLLRARAQGVGLPVGFPGAEGEARVEVELLAPLPVLLRGEVPPCAPLGTPPLRLGGLAWGRHRLTLPLPYRLRRRGAHALALGLEATGLLGLPRRTLLLPLGEALVYPALRPLPPFRPAPGFFLEGLRTPRGLPDPLEAKGLRPYRPGDPPRLLARKATLRRGEPLVREPERRMQGALFLHLDGQSLHPAYPDHAASLAAWLLLQAEREGMAFGLSLGGGRLPLGRGRAHLQRALALLARFAPSPTPTPPPPAPPGSTYLLITQAAERAFLEGALKGAKRAREGLLLLLPEGYFLFPGERGRKAFGVPPGLQRALALKGVLLAHGLRLQVVRGHEPLRFGGE
ncbi:DUF58 domain-containing protein [Thermus oshimai]|uniref:DUF58 domain-containing protein n=1 Tax=Thermus oshimai TaxID=56957 RepID=UPI00035F5E4D|nr:DUF58 domain-containing protein [Thermus oshimai]